MLKRLLLLQQIPLNADLGLLALRLVVFVTLFFKHGTEKLFTFGTMLQTWNIDPFHIGLLPTLVIAMIADGICSVLIVIGLGTRWAAAFMAGNLFVALGLVHHFEIFGKGPKPGEPLILYLAVTLTLFFIGAGKYSMDGLIEGSLKK